MTVGPNRCCAAQVHPWVTSGGKQPMPAQEENCILITVTDEEVEDVVKHFARLDTLVSGEME